MSDSLWQKLTMKDERKYHFEDPQFVHGLRKMEKNEKNTFFYHSCAVSFNSVLMLKVHLLNVNYENMLIIDIFRYLWNFLGI